MKMRKNFALMAWSTGQESREAGNFARYIGVGSVTVEAINPTKEKLEEILGTELESAPAYIGVQEQDGKEIQYGRLEFVLHTVPENNDGIDTIIRMSLFLRNAYRYNREKTKTQVIDKYGRTAWVTAEELKNHTIPTYSNGKLANIDADYRQCYQGEEDVTNFFKAFLNIPSPMVYKNKEWVPVKNLEDCLARFDKIGNIFKGDFSEFIEAWQLQKANKVKVLCGIRTTDEGRQYQTVYTRMFLRNSASSYDALERDVKATQEAGGMPTSEFRICPLQEYKVESTSLEESKPSGPNPFGDPEENKFFK